MKNKSYTYNVPDFGGTAEDWQTEREASLYKCKPCHIKYNDGEWKIPKEYRPSKKQRNTVLFIENRMGYVGAALTAKQAHEIISKNFEEAKEIPLHDDQYYEDIQKAYGMDYGDFC